MRLCAPSDKAIEHGIYEKVEAEWIGCNPLAVKSPRVEKDNSLVYALSVNRGRSSLF